MGRGVLLRLRVEHVQTSETKRFGRRRAHDEMSMTIEEAKVEDRERMVIVLIQAAF